MNFIKRAEELCGISVPFICTPSFTERVWYYMHHGYPLDQAIIRALKDMLLLH